MSYSVTVTLRVRYDILCPFHESFPHYLCSDPNKNGTLFMGSALRALRFQAQVVSRDTKVNTINSLVRRYFDV